MAIETPMAFPSEQHECQDGTWNQTYDPGMSLRDWFAGQSINSLLITATGVKIAERIIAEGAYAIADAMLAERLAPDQSDATSRADLYKAERDELLLAVVQYGNDLRYPPEPDSVERRLAMIDALVAKVSGS